MRVQYLTLWLVVRVVLKASPGEYPSRFLQRRAGDKEAKRGDAILISMERYPQGKERHGAQLDRGRLDALFKSLYFDVKHLVDKGAKDLKDDLRKISEGICNETSDCFVCFVSAHGNTDEHGHYIEDEHDSKMYINNDILKPFMTCDALKGIPKVFFINSCRGDSKKQIRSTESIVEYTKNWKDSLLMFSTEEGNESGRSPKSGTFFVQVLYESIMENHEKEDVGVMVTMANKMLRKNSEEIWLKSQEDKPKCQVAPIYFNLTGKLFWRTRDPSESSAGKPMLCSIPLIEERRSMAMVVATATGPS